MLGLVFATTVFGHGAMIWPPSWLDPGGDLGLQPYTVCLAGQCYWFSNYTFVVERTMPADSIMRTYAISDPDYKLFGNNPWAAPGAAEVFSPCGIYGGNPVGCPPNSGEGKKGDPCGLGGFAYGVDALEDYADQTRLHDIRSTDVKAGGELDVHWITKANHGGGYSYRLCKMPADGDHTKITEECFQAGHLGFASDDSWIQFGDDEANRMSFKARRTTNGTHPKGSVWTQNPVPACAQEDGGVYTEHTEACENALKEFGVRTQFPPRIPGIQGYGEHPHWSPSTFGFNVVDRIQIPADLTPGDYVLSFRWDCEETSQVWTTCADLKIGKTFLGTQRMTPTI